MKTTLLKTTPLILALALTGGSYFNAPQPTAYPRNDPYDPPPGRPSPEPFPTPEEEPPPFGCYYVIIDGQKHLVCE